MDELMLPPDPAAVRRLEDAVWDLPQVDLGTQLVVHGRMAVRTVFIPAGTVVTGAQTKIDNVCIVVGDITVTTDEGPQRITGHRVLTAKAGFKRAGIAHADTWWTTIHHTDHTDVQAIEDEMTDEADRLQTRRQALSHTTHKEIEA